MAASRNLAVDWRWFGFAGERLYYTLQARCGATSQKSAISSVLVTGSSGSGKTSLVLSLCKDLGIPVFVQSPSDVLREEPGFPERTIYKIINKFSELDCAVVIWDHLNELCPTLNTSALVLQALRKVNNAAQEHRRVVLIGIVQSERSLDTSALSLFEDKIRIEPPSVAARLAMLKAATAMLTIENQTSLETINQKLHGYLWMDVQAVVAGAYKSAVFRNGGNLNTVITELDLVQSHKAYRLPSSQGIAVPRTIETVSWDQIGGLEDVKKRLQEVILWTQQHAVALRQMGVSPPRGVLLFGPPGTGKTMLAKAVATSTTGSFMPITIPDLLKAEVGESEKAIARVFAGARRNAPCVVFIDEMEALFGLKDSQTDVHSKMISQLLLELDGLDSQDNDDAFVFVLAATNAPDCIDDAFLRSGRLDVKLYVSPPDLLGRISILQLYTKTMPLNSDVNLQFIAQNTEGFTGADLHALCQRAAIQTIDRVHRESVVNQPVTVAMQDFQQALNDSSPSLDPGALLRFLQFT